ncbi:hypothetical protein N9P21_00795 [Rhodobacteraceae bacterium]|jgi:hypothetical protein|nr:hypothetical protein [Paracoccaceae bacterium]
MGLNSDIVEVKTQMDRIIAGKADRLFDVSDYNLRSKDRKNMKSVYGLIHNILHHGEDGERIIDRTRNNNLDYFYEKCVAHLKSHK